jgi:hypothetical protein
VVFQLQYLILSTFADFSSYYWNAEREIITAIQKHLVLHPSVVDMGRANTFVPFRKQGIQMGAVQNRF